MALYYLGEGEEERSYEVTTLEDGNYQVVTPAGETFIIDAYRPEDGRLHFLLEGRAFDVDARNTRDEKWSLLVEKEWHEVEVLNERQRRMRRAGGGKSRANAPELFSPMAGKVIELKVAVGDTVTQGQPVIIVEAMKMENDLKAHSDGTVTAIQVEPGQAVEIGDVLLVISSPDEEA